jgi:hypothetical protein
MLHLVQQKHLAENAADSRYEVTLQLTQLRKKEGLFLFLD